MIVTFGPLGAAAIAAMLPGLSTTTKSVAPVFSPDFLRDRARVGRMSKGAKALHHLLRHRQVIGVDFSASFGEVRRKRSHALNAFASSGKKMSMR
jgi:hypothetical protein